MIDRWTVDEPLPGSGTFHRGQTRRYFCPTAIDKGKLKGPDYGSRVIADGEEIPLCSCHGMPMDKPRWKRIEEKMWERKRKTRIEINGMAIWKDEAKRKSTCRLCNATIEKGEQRIAFDFLGRGPAMRTYAGGVIRAIRHYVHFTCFMDLLMDGDLGKGCPGCTAKVINDEFRIVRKQILDSHA